MDELVRDSVAATDPGLFVGRRLANVNQFYDWVKGLGLSGLSDIELDPNLHVTVLYSTHEIPWVDEISIVTAKAKGWGLLGPENAVVILLDAPELESRWKDAISAGAVTTYDTFTPHLTLFYAGAGYDSTEYRDGNHPPLPPFDLVLGPEVSAPLDDDAFARGLIALEADKTRRDMFAANPSKWPGVEWFVPHGQEMHGLGAADIREALDALEAEVSRSVAARSRDFSEDKHPRDPNGKFAAGSGGQDSVKVTDDKAGKAAQADALMKQGKPDAHTAAKLKSLGAQVDKVATDKEAGKAAGQVKAEQAQAIQTAHDGFQITQTVGQVDPGLKAEVEQFDPKTVAASAVGTWTAYIVTAIGAPAGFSLGQTGTAQVAALGLKGALDGDMDHVVPDLEISKILDKSDLPMIQKQVADAIQKAQAAKLVVVAPDIQHGIKAYLSNNYDAINKSLRGYIGGAPTIEVKTAIDGVDRAIQNEAPTAKPEQVWRGFAVSGLLGSGANGVGLVGQTLTDKGFVSTSSKATTALTYLKGADASRSGAGGLMRINLPVGVKALPTEHAGLYQGMDEVILPRGSSYEVKSGMQAKNGTWIYDVDYHAPAIKVQAPVTPDLSEKRIAISDKVGSASAVETGWRAGLNIIQQHLSALDAKTKAPGETTPAEAKPLAKVAEPAHPLSPGEANPEDETMPLGARFDWTKETVELKPTFVPGKPAPVAQVAMKLSADKKKALAKAKAKAEQEKADQVGAQEPSPSPAQSTSPHTGQPAQATQTVKKVDKLDAKKATKAAAKPAAKPAKKPKRDWRAEVEETRAELSRFEVERFRGLRR